MKPLLLILALAFSVSAQEIKQIEQIKDWKLIKEMSGDIPNHPGLTEEFYAAKIARGDSTVKLLVRMDFPWGAPRFEGATYPRGFDASSIRHVLFQVELNCDTLVVKPLTGEADVYQFNGKHLKSQEIPTMIKSGHIFEQYFCEHGEAPTKAPTLKPKP
jgi:hypothetical protein